MEKTALYEKFKKETVFIVGPCVMESLELMEVVAEELVQISRRNNVEIVFKSSFDKANRTSIESYRGPGLEKGLEWLQIIKDKYKLSVTTDIHESWHANACAEVVDVIQIPAFLCRQTDLVVEAAKTGRIVNIKKAQFLTATDMRYPLLKAMSTGNEQICLTERGTMYGGSNLVVDFRNVAELVKLGCPIIMDATHSVQKPGGATTGGSREFILPNALAAKIFGATSFFFEAHPNPTSALSDGPNMLFLKDVERTIQMVIKQESVLNN